MEVRTHQHIVQPAANENNILVFRPRFGNFQTIFFLTLYPSLMLFPNESEPVYVSVVPPDQTDGERQGKIAKHQNVVWQWAAVWQYTGTPGRGRWERHKSLLSGILTGPEICSGEVVPCAVYTAVQVTFTLPWWSARHGEIKNILEISKYFQTRKNSLKIYKCFFSLRNLIL